MAITDAVCIPAKCGKTSRDFYMMYYKAFDGKWVLTYGKKELPRSSGGAGNAVAVKLDSVRTGPQYKCPHCGQKCDANEKFCGKCGTPLFNESIPVGGVTPTVTQDTPPVYYDEDDGNHNMRILLAICAVVLLLIGGFLGWKYLYKGKFFKKKTELVSDSINADSAKTWEQVTFEGVMYDEDGHD